MKKNWKRMLSLLLAVCMLAGLLVMPAVADGEGEVEPGTDGPATTFTITVTEPENGTVIVKKDGAEATEAAKGAQITVAATAGDGYELETITVTDEDDADVTVTTEGNVGTFEMPASNVTVTVTFVEDAGGGDEEPNPPASRTVTFEGNHFSVEEIKQDETDLELADGVYTANTTDDITFKVAADDDYEITAVEVDGAALTDADGVYTIEAGMDNVTVTITATEKTVTPPDPDTFTITVNGGTADKAEAAEGESVTVTANTPETGKVFDKWTTDDLTLSATDEVKGTLTFTMPGNNVTLTATFKPEGGDEPGPPVTTKFAVTYEAVDAEGVTLTVEGLPTDTEVEENGTVTLPGSLTLEGYTFVNWTKDGGAEAVSGEQTITAVTKFVAHFTEDEGGETVNKGALNAAITAANDKKAGVEISTNGKDIAKDKTWVTQEAMDALKEKLTAAQTVAAKGGATQGEVDEATEALTTATNAFTPAAGTKVDKSALDAAIDQAEALDTTLVTSENGENIPQGTQWVTAKMKEDLTTALTSAKDVNNDEEATQEEVDDAAAALTTAIEAYQPADGKQLAADVSGLQTAVAAAKAKMTGVATSENDGADIDKDKTWVTPAVKAALEQAITDAGTVIAKGESATAEEITAAAQALKTASDAFVPASGKFETKYTITVTGGVADKTEAAEGESVTVTANPPETGKVFDKWTTEDLTLSDTEAAENPLTFAMPSNDVTLTATYKAVGGETVDKTALEAAIAAAVANINAVKESVDGSDVPTSEMWVTPKAKADYQAAIDAAKSVADAESATQDQVDAAVTNLASATTIFEAAKKAGTKTGSGEEPLPSGDPFDVVPGNLGQIDDNSALPANGLAIGYTVTGIKTTQGPVYVSIQADYLIKHANANGAEGYWIGFGMPIEDGKDYTYCLVENGVDGQPIASIPGRVQTVAGKNYNTVYFDLAAGDAGKSVTYTIKQTEGDNATVYNVNIKVAKLVESLDKALDGAIKDAEAAKKDVVTGTKSSDVSKSKKWVTEEEMKALTDVIEAAKTVAAKTDATAAEQTQAIAKLNEAVKTFEAAKKDGTKRTNPGGGGGSSSTPSVDAGDKTSETLADGTKRDTETAKDGTVTVTETKPDGTKTVTTTTPAGEVSTAVTLGKDVKSAKVTVPVNNANSSMVAMVVKADGTEEIIRDTAVVDGKVIFGVDKDATVRIVNNAKNFVDIRGHWGQAYVNFVSARELFNGVDASHFAPDAAMTRGMMATVLFRLDGETKSSTNLKFSDVKAGEWYSDAVAWAAKVGIVNGYTDGTFLPTRSINREELAVMIYRYAKAAGLVTEGSDTLLYADAGQVSDWAKEAVSWLTAHGILNGRLGNRFEPKGNATRAEVSAVLERYVTLVNK